MNLADTTSAVHHFSTNLNEPSMVCSISYLNCDITRYCLQYSFHLQNSHDND